MDLNNTDMAKFCNVIQGKIQNNTLEGLKTLSIEELKVLRIAIDHFANNSHSQFNIPVSIQNKIYTTNRSEYNDLNISPKDISQKNIITKDDKSQRINQIEEINILLTKIEGERNSILVPEGSMRMTKNESSENISNSAVLQSERNTIRDKLISEAVLPSPEQAKESFWSLGEDWWKQIIDGRCHKYGPMVFDQGLHRGATEPGYLQGIKNGSEYLMNNIGDELSVKLYSGIHHEACDHFKDLKGEEHGVISEANETDRFRTKNAFAKVHVQDKEISDIEKQLDQISKVKEDLKKAKRKLEKENDDGEIQEVIKKAKSILGLTDDIVITIDDLPSLLRLQDRKLQNLSDTRGEKFNEEMNAHFLSIANKYEIKVPFVASESVGPLMQLRYQSNKDLNFEDITKKMISNYNDQIANLQKKAYDSILAGKNPEKAKKDYQQAVIPHIAALYADLEWAHPWPDGQGRTDLILLNGLLCREGLHPCILNEPFFSSGSNPKDWETYLQTSLHEYENLLKLKG